MKMDAAVSFETLITMYRTPGCRDPSQYELFTAVGTSDIILVVSSHPQYTFIASMPETFLAEEYRNGTER
jgi:hypothetical protein